MKCIKVCIFFLSVHQSVFSFIPNDNYLPWLDCAQQLAMNVPSSFGKTHFLIGYTPSPQISQKKASQQTVVSTGNHCAFFTPDDDVRAELIKLINEEQEAIRIAIFMMTDQSISDALVKARKRNIKVEVVTDPAGLRDRKNKIGILCDNNLLIYVYHGQYAKAGSSSIMHHKFALFSKNRNNKQLLWTGSFNFTRVACDSNQENVIILDDGALFGRYLEQFNKLKQRSYRYHSEIQE